MKGIKFRKKHLERKHESIFVHWGYDINIANFKEFMNKLPELIYELGNSAEYRSNVQKDAFLNTSNKSLGKWILKYYS